MKYRRKLVLPVLGPWWFLLQCAPASPGADVVRLAEGVYAISQQQHPRMVAQKLRAFAGAGLRVDDITARLARTPTEAIRVSA